MTCHVTTVDGMNTALLKPAEVASELRLSRATIYRLIASGDLPTVHVGARKATRVEASALADYIAKNRSAA
jgi:excisionase family DNA binding protein